VAEYQGLDAVIQMLGNTAFPIAVAWFLLTRVEKAVNGIAVKLEDLVNELRTERISRTN
jgi:hypothetical protein